MSDSDSDSDSWFCCRFIFWGTPSRSVHSELIDAAPSDDHVLVLAGAWVLFAVSAFVSYACKMCCGSETNTNRHMTESHQTRTSGRYVARETGGRQAIQTHVDSMRNGNARIVTPATNSIV